MDRILKYNNNNNCYKKFSVYVGKGINCKIILKRKQVLIVSLFVFLFSEIEILIGNCKGSEQFLEDYHYRQLLKQMVTIDYLLRYQSIFSKSSTILINLNFLKITANYRYLREDYP